MVEHTQEGTVVVAIYNDVAEATAAKETLAENGINSFFIDENVVGLNPLGGIELKVFEHDVLKAKELLGNQ